MGNSLGNKEKMAANFCKGIISRRAKLKRTTGRFSTNSGTKKAPGYSPGVASFLSVFLAGHQALQDGSDFLAPHK